MAIPIYGLFLSILCGNVLFGEIGFANTPYFALLRSQICVIWEKIIRKYALFREKSFTNTPYFALLRSQIHIIWRVQVRK
jgi:hypothetical protein